MYSFQLFRVSLSNLTQKSLFSGEKTREDILYELIKELSAKGLKQKERWHLGTVHEIDDSSIYFRFGKASKQTLEIYKDGDFLDQEHETAPYTHVFIDLRFEICAIAKRTTLAPKTKSIANNLKSLLNDTVKAFGYDIEINIKEIIDPVDFLTYLKDAYSISKFWTKYSRPNPFDVNEDFIKPAQRLVAESGADAGKTELKGNDLDKKLLEDLSRSAAATGNDASATLKLGQKDKSITKRLKDKPVYLKIKDEILVDEQSNLREVISKIRKKYMDVRKEKDE